MRPETKSRAIMAGTIIFGLTAGLLCGNRLVKNFLRPGSQATMAPKKTLVEDVKIYLQLPVFHVDTVHNRIIDAIIDGIDHARRTPSQKLQISGFDFCG